MDALELIAEAQSRQRQAERDRDHWKAMAESKGRRCKLLVAMMRLRALPVPVLDAERNAHWKQLMHVLDEIVPVFADPYARYPEDGDEYASLTHERAKDMLAYRLQSLIKAAAEAQ